MQTEIKRVYWFFYGKRYWHKNSIKSLLKKLNIKRKPKRAKREALLELERLLDEQDNIYR